MSTMNFDSFFLVDEEAIGDRTLSLPVSKELPELCQD